MNATSPQHPSAQPPGHPGRRVRWVPLFFGVIAPLCELATIIAVGSAVGAAWTFLLLAAGVVVGGMLVSRQARRSVAAAREQADLAMGRPLTAGPTPPKPGAGWLVLAGVLFLAPGFASDAVALLLLLTPVRRLASLGLKAAGLRWFAGLQEQAVRPPGRGDVVTGEVIDPDDRPPST